jgi:hypothetical protein
MRLPLKPVLQKSNLPQKQMSKIIPLISSSVSGPLGVQHLPRLWLKISLDNQGILCDGYPAVGAGFDSMVINGLGLNQKAVVSFIAQNKPTYPQFETWVKSQPGVKLDADSVSKLNQSIAGYIHDDETRESILSDSGIPDEGKIRDAINLNNLEDWHLFHQAFLK